MTTVTLLGVVGCKSGGGGGADGGGAPSGTLPPRIAEELEHHDCVACHEPGGEDGPAAGLDLTPGVAFGNMVDKPSKQAKGMKIVVLGDPGASYLMNKLRGTHKEVGGKGKRMPRGKTAKPMDDAEIAEIEAWIAGQ